MLNLSQDDNKTARPHLDETTLDDMERLLTGSMDTKMFLEITTSKTFFTSLHNHSRTCLMYGKIYEFLFYFIFLTEVDSFTVDSFGCILDSLLETKEK